MPTSNKSVIRLGLVVLFLLISTISTVYAADFNIRPSITISEEYNDNVFETNNKTADYITRVIPGIAFGYSAPFWDWDLSYNYDYRYYARNSRNGDDTHNLATKGLLRLIDDFLLLDISDTYSRVSLDVSRDRTQEGLFANQSDSNIFTASPYIKLHPGRSASVKTGYRYTNVWYKDPSGIDRRDHVGFMEATYELSPKLNLTANYTYTHENSRTPYDRHDPNLGFKYEYGDRSSIFGQGGYTWFNSRNGTASNDPFWNAGITHSFDHISIKLLSGVQYPVDPVSGVTRETDYSLEINKDLNRGSVGASVYYSKYKGNNIVINGNPSGSIADISNKYGAGITAKLELTTKLTGSLTSSIERYNKTSTNSYTRRILVNPILSYALPREFTIGLNYAFIDSYSPVTLTDRYQINRISLELTKSFGRELERFRTSDKK
jgi:hypothetical protein